MAKDYSPQSILDRAMIGLSYYESLGKPGDQQAMLEKTYTSGELSNAMIALVGSIVNMMGFKALEGQEDSDITSDELEAATIQGLRQALIGFGAMYDGRNG